MKLLQKSISPLVVGALSGLLVLIDHFLAPLFMEGVSFVWLAFISWTVFFASPLQDRFKVLPSYIVGFLGANAMILLGGMFGAPSVLASAIGTFIIITLVMYLADVKFLTIPGIFIGSATSFAGVGFGLSSWSIPLFGLVFVYGVLGLLCGHITIVLVDFLSNEKKNPPEGKESKKPSKI